MGDADIVVGFFPGICDFEDVATDPTVQIGTSPNVYLAGNPYTCGNLDDGHAVALFGGTMKTPPDQARIEAAWKSMYVAFA